MSGLPTARTAERAERAGRAIKREQPLGPFFGHGEPYSLPLRFPG